MKGFMRGLLWACLALILCVIAAALWGLRRHSMRPIEARQRVLLHRTDHGQLREAMRELWQGSRHAPRSVTHEPRGAGLPPAIRALGAHHILVWPGGVNVEMGGQWCHFGFDAYFAGHPADRDRPVWKDAYPSREVVPELWYYGENGLVEP